MKTISKFIIRALISMLALILGSCSAEYPIVKENKYVDYSNSHISLEEARTDLLGLLSTIDNSNTRSGIKQRKIANEFSFDRIIETTRSERKEIDTISLYVFNFEQDMGFAIMSGDKRIPSLLAVTERGNLDPTIENLVPEGMMVFFDRLDKGLSKMVYNIDSSSDYVDITHYEYTEWENIIRCRPMCKVKWGQNEPYNSELETINGQHPRTGCVATAVAQLMSVYKFPNSYNGHIYCWDEMTQYTYGNSCSDSGQHAMALLMKDLGESKNLEMDYGLDSSGTKSKRIPRTMKNFGYSSKGVLKDYSTTEIVKELSNGFPVLVGGYSQKNKIKFYGITIWTYYTKGHQWLAHGLLERSRYKIKFDSKGKEISRTTESEWYPLYNWGWEGSYDGYFLSGTFDSTNGSDYPEWTRTGEEDDDSDYDSGEPYNYQYEPDMVIGIRQ